MRGIAIRWLTLTGAIIVTSYMLDGIQVNGIFSAFFAAAFLSILNAFFRPVLILTLTSYSKHEQHRAKARERVRVKVRGKNDYEGGVLKYPYIKKKPPCGGFTQTMYYSAADVRPPICFAKNFSIAA